MMDGEWQVSFPAALPIAVIRHCTRQMVRLQRRGDLCYREHRRKGPKLPLCGTRALYSGIFRPNTGKHQTDRCTFPSPEQARRVFHVPGILPIGSIMKQRVLAIATFLLIMQGTLVEQELQAQLISPDVRADSTVTFRLRAPHAEKVLVQGIAGREDQAMTKNSDGVWEATVGPLAPELYSYVFNVDGTVVTDPSNRNVKKWLSLNSQVEVPGDPPLLHELQKVPHGVVHYHVYTSETTGTERGVYVYTPPGYGENGSERFPLVVLMHGYGDDESAWIEVGRAHRIADNLLARQKMKPMIIAMPYGHPLPIELRSSFDDYSSRQRRKNGAGRLSRLDPLPGFALSAHG